MMLLRKQKVEQKKGGEQVSKFYEVEKILKKRTVNGKIKYLIKWKGYSQAESTWEPYSHLSHLKVDLDNFQRQKEAEKKKQRGKKTKTKFISHENMSEQINRSTGYACQPKKKRITQKDKTPKTTIQQQETEKEPYLNSLSQFKKHDQVKVQNRVLEPREGWIFTVQKNGILLELTEKQTKLLFPYELSLYYEEQVKALIFSKKQI